MTILCRVIVVNTDMGQNQEHDLLPPFINRFQLLICQILQTASCFSFQPDKTTSRVPHQSETNGPMDLTYKFGSQNARPALITLCLPYNT